MSLHSGPKPGIDRGEGLDHGVEASMPFWIALMTELTCLSIHSLCPSCEAVRLGESWSLTVCRSCARFVLVQTLFLIGVAGCQSHVMAVAMGRWSESQSRL